jgi:uncharacterized protein YbgA (DUF1722 family)/uncharacterized protein YbbK (DUF523 family)
MTDTQTAKRERPLLGIGSCLAGNEVRYNGQSKAANVHVRALCETFEARAFCPEMGIGMGVPRPPIHLVGDEDRVRVVDVETHQNDYTDKIRGFAQTVLSLAPDLCGYILVKGSPSCGFDRVKRFNDKGNVVALDQRGMFTSALAELDPLLPLEDDGRLNDPPLRESFVTRVVAYHEWKQLVADGLSAKAIVEFWSRYKYLVMAHHVPSYKALGPMVASIGKVDLDSAAAEFIATMMEALTRRATRRSHSNVLFHLSGYLKRSVSGPERQRLAELIDQYRQGLVPLVVPITMLRHHFANNPNAYIEQQAFLEPYPDHLKVRNLV